MIQSLGICPRLLNFVMTILNKLITKQVCGCILFGESIVIFVQVWKQPKVWQGFVKCCEVNELVLLVIGIFVILHTYTTIGYKATVISNLAATSATPT